MIIKKRRIVSLFEKAHNGTSATNYLYFLWLLLYFSHGGYDDKRTSNNSNLQNVCENS